MRLIEKFSCSVDLVSSFCVIITTGSLSDVIFPVGRAIDTELAGLDFSGENKILVFEQGLILETAVLTD